MKLVSNVLRSVNYGFAHWCPGCGEMHYITVSRPSANGAIWWFNGNVDKPTFSPSIHIKTGPYPDNDSALGSKPMGHIDICHYFLREGVLEFLPDCTHDLKGRSIPLPEIPDSHR
jgi:hypothetical protein